MRLARDHNYVHLLAHTLIASVQAVSFCDLFLLVKGDFDDVGKLFPEVYEKVVAIGKKRFKELLELVTQTDATKDATSSVAGAFNMPKRKPLAHISGEAGAENSDHGTSHSVMASAMDVVSSSSHGRRLQSAERKEDRSCFPKASDFSELEVEAITKVQRWRRRVRLNAQLKQMEGDTTRNSISRSLPHISSGVSYEMMPGTPVLSPGRQLSSTDESNGPNEGGKKQPIGEHIRMLRLQYKMTSEILRSQKVMEDRQKIIEDRIVKVETALRSGKSLSGLSREAGRIRSSLRG